MTVADWTTAALAVLALLIAVTSAKFTRDQRDLARENVAAANDTAEATRRQAEAAEQEPAILRAGHEESLAARSSRPKWTVAHHFGDLFALTNAGDTVAFGVEVTPPPHSAVGEAPYRFQMLAPGGSVLIGFAPSMVTPAAAAFAIDWTPSQEGEGSSQHASVLIPPRR